MIFFSGKSKASMVNKELVVNTSLILTGRDSVYTVKLLVWNE
jgi:hypothetical protein